MADDSDEPQSLADLGNRLRAAREREAGNTKPARSAGGDMGAGMGLGFRIAVELVAAIAVGSLIGYALDRWLGTRPWLMVVFFFMGGAAGVMNVYRAAKGLDSSVGLGGAVRRKEQDGPDGS